MGQRQHPKWGSLTLFIWSSKSKIGFPVYPETGLFQAERGCNEACAARVRRKIRTQRVRETSKMSRSSQGDGRTGLQVRSEKWRGDGAAGSRVSWEAVHSAPARRGGGSFRKSSPGSSVEGDGRDSGGSNQLEGHCRARERWGCLEQAAVVGWGMGWSRRVLAQPDWEVWWRMPASPPNPCHADLEPTILHFPASLQGREAM